MSLAVTPTALVSFFGKTPAHGDFVRPRIASRDLSELGFDDWLHSAVGAVHAAGLALDAAPLHFALFAKEHGAVLTGVMVASQDRVGRAFPCGLCCLWPREFGLQPWAMPVAAESFSAGAADLLSKDPAAAGDCAELSELSPPSTRTAQYANGVAGQGLADARARNFFERCFGELDVTTRAHYALHTLLMAVQAVGQSGPPVVLDCPLSPAGDATDQCAWLALANELGANHGAQVSACCWRPEANRFLLSLGAPSPQLLRYWLDCDSRSARLWPLCSERQDVVAQVLRASGLPAERLIGPPGMTVGGLVDGLQEVARDG